MIVDAICEVCKKRIGYASITGDDVIYLKNTDRVCTLRNGTRFYMELLCDDCGQKRIDLEDHT